MTTTTLTISTPLIEPPPPIDPEYAARVEAEYGLTCLPRWGTRRNWDRPTLGPKIAKVSRALGTPFMPWQRYTADIGLEIDLDSGLLAYRGVDLTVPRQSGKTTTVLGVSVHRGIAWQRQRILYAAQTGTAARDKWEDEHLPILESSKAMQGRYRVRKQNGREAIIWTKTRSIHTLTTNKEQSGHGKVLDLAMLDEYFAQVDYRLDQATGPAMITRRNAQKWRLSTAGTSRSGPFNAMRARGRAQVASGRPGRIAFFDWCALPGMDRADPGTWRSCMPALCPAPVRGACRCSSQWRHTVLEDAIAAELESMADEPEEFDRAYLNISRDDGEVQADPHVPPVEAWQALEDRDAVSGPVLALAVDVTPQRDHAAIMAAGETPSGRLLIAVLEHGPGIRWVVAALARRVEELKPVAVALDDRSPAGNLVVKFEEAGIKRMGRDKPHHGGLWIPTAPELGAACASFTDAVTEGRAVHRGQAEMTTALAGAKSRSLGDGGFAWARRHSGADISPLVGGSLAVGAYERFKHLRPSAGPNLW